MRTEPLKPCYNCTGQGHVFAGIPNSREPDTRKILVCPICKGAGYRTGQLWLFENDEYLPVAGQN